MFIHPDIDPVFFQLPVFHLFGHAIGPIRCYWYGLMYVVGFIAIWALANWRAKSYGFTHKQIDDLIFFAILGVILGGRLGYVLFYDFSMFLAHPSLIVKTWQGGMSFHGGLIGVMIALLWFAHREKRTFFSLTDFVAPFVPIGLGLGRIGNFINGELWGRVTHVPWAMVYPKVDNLPRHPSELYECALEGVVLFILMMVFSAKRPPEKAVSALFLIAYGLFRFCLEFFRMPDAQVGFIAFGWLTMGQLLCVPMILFGVGLWIAAYRKTPKHPEQTA